MPDGPVILLIVNPTSGRGRGARTARAVSRLLEARGATVIVRETRGAGEAEHIARKILQGNEARPRCVVGCGGDGTMQEVANALANLRAPLGDACPPMGIAPTGRCNDLARALAIPGNPAAITDVLLRGPTRDLDLGRVNGRFFCTVATLGVDAEVSRFVDTMKVPLRGTLAYVYGALRVLSRYRPYSVRITGDCGMMEKPIFIASSANTSSYGGAIEIAPDADPTDGWLELCVIDRVSRPRAFVLLAAVLMGRHRRFGEVNFLRVRRVRIEADKPLEVWADGEKIADTPIDIDVVPAAVQVLVPATSH